MFSMPRSITLTASAVYEEYNDIPFHEDACLTRG